jgi:hypothetical protein
MFCQIEDDAGTNFAESVDLSGGCHYDKQKILPGHGNYSLKLLYVVLL